MLKKLAGLGNLLQPGQFFLLFFPPMAYFNKTEILRKLAGLGETLASLLQPGLFFLQKNLQLHKASSLSFTDCALLLSYMWAVN